MSILDTLFSVIDMRSFSNLWYWIALAVTWSSASHWVLGVPFDMVLRARRKGGQAGVELVAMTRVSVTRILTIWRDGGMLLAVMVPFILTTLLILGFGYGAEFAQATVLILLPLACVGLLSLRAAGRLEATLKAEPDPDDIAKALAYHRLKIQAIGILAIVVTALWGMIQNFRLWTFG
ncbi:component of SufBCD complex [Sedimentimonas flavescens]|uniref:Component of SufBCD complex n=1 Tax=Sedimentimonas flavescens TaxID=2851012 RepID=A0ABT2ZXQ8_9RHOB|nr:component of SufBCD complex [Sedimentimonas flavescens]MCV2878387.1 component of SufBCD complex [Sedimentimonas flavescens]